MSTAEASPVILVESRILNIRHQKVLLDSDLAALYQVEGALNRAVGRNSDRFPEDFMFQLTAEEAHLLSCQIGISNLTCQTVISNLTCQTVISSRGGRRYRPYAFTEQGIAGGVNNFV